MCQISLAQKIETVPNTFVTVDKTVLVNFGMIRKEFNTFNEDARLSIQHWNDLWHKRVYKINQRRVRDNPEEYFSYHGIVEVVRVTTEQQHGLDYMEQIIVMRENNKSVSFSEADFKYLNMNDIEYMYYLCLNKKVNFRENKLLNSLMTFIKSYVIWERVNDFQLGIESYQIKIDLIVPTLIFLAIDPYSIFCDAMLERVLKKVKLKIFETEFWKKPPLLGELDLDIMKALEREITKHLRVTGFDKSFFSLDSGFDLFLGFEKSFLSTESANGVGLPMTNG
ncbi:hypothetical protein Tco_1449586 [Tanacetum coccineum]